MGRFMDVVRCDLIITKSYGSGLFWGKTKTDRDRVTDAGNQMISGVRGGGGGGHLVRVTDTANRPGVITKKKRSRPRHSKRIPTDGKD